MIIMDQAKHEKQQLTDTVMSNQSTVSCLLTNNWPLVVQNAAAQHLVDSYPQFLDLSVSGLSDDS